MSEPKRLWIALFIAIVIFTAEFTTGVLANGTALLGDSFHVFTDFLSLGIGLWAVAAVARPRTARESFGYAKAKSALAPCMNGVLLGGIGFTVLLRALEWCLKPETPRDLGLICTVAVIGFAGNVLAFFVLRRGTRSANLNAVLAHVLSDAATSVAAIASAVLIAGTGNPSWNPILNAGIGLWMVGNGFRIVRRAVPELLDITPADFPFAQFCTAVLAVEGVAGIEHGPHVTTRGEERHAALHVILKPVVDWAAIEREIITVSRTRFGIRHLDVQPHTSGSVCQNECPVPQPVS